MRWHQTAKNTVIKGAKIRMANQARNFDLTIRGGSSINAPKKNRELSMTVVIKKSPRRDAIGAVVRLLFVSAEAYQPPVRLATTASAPRVLGGNPVAVM